MYLLASLLCVHENPVYLWVSEFGEFDAFLFLTAPERFVNCALDGTGPNGSSKKGKAFLIFFALCYLRALAALFIDWHLRAAIWPLLVGYGVAAAAALPVGSILFLGAFL